MCFPRALARLLPSAVRVRIRSRSTSARPPSTASIKRPCRCRCRPAVPPGSKLRLSVHDLLNDSEQVEGAAREAVDPGDCHHVAGSEVLKHFEKLAAVVVRARHFLAINLGGATGGAKLHK